MPPLLSNSATMVMQMVSAFRKQGTAVCRDVNVAESRIKASAVFLVTASRASCAPELGKPIIFTRTCFYSPSCYETLNSSPSADSSSSVTRLYLSGSERMAVKVHVGIKDLTSSRNYHCPFVWSQMKRKAGRHAVSSRRPLSNPAFDKSLQTSNAAIQLMRSCAAP